MPASQVPRWRGTRGQWYVADQLVLIAVVFVGPRTLPGLPVWPGPLARISVIVGAALMLADSGLLVAGLLRRGSSLTRCPIQGRTQSWFKPSPAMQPLAAKGPA